jgi:hypothetical protein
MTWVNDVVLSAHQRALDAPERLLGTVERNTEIKTAYLALWVLGWDPVEDVAFGFHVAPTEPGVRANKTRAADLVLRDQVGLCAIGEVKHWFSDDKDWSIGIEELRRYQRAVPVPRAFLTCGRRWLILDEDGHMLIDVEGKDSRKLIEVLRPHLGKGSIDGQLRDRRAWNYGINPSGSNDLEA